MSTRSLIEYSLFLLNICGVDPTKQNLRSKCVSAITLSALFLLLIEFGLEFALNWKGWDSLDEFAPCFAFYQVLFKMMAMVVSMAKLRALLISFDEFWILTNYEIENIFKTARTAMKSYGIAAVVTLSTYFFKPFFSTGKVLPFDTYHPLDYNQTLDYQLMYLFQTFNMGIAWSSMYGFESLFFSIIIHLICELKIIKHRFCTMKVNLDVSEDDDSTLQEIKELVDHHNLVLECIKSVNEIYSIPLLNQFLSSLFCITAGLLGTIVSGFPPDMTHLANFTLYMASILGQLFIYCLGGAFLMAEAEGVSDAVYQSDWWIKTQPKLRKSYLLILQRAQKKERLTAGGMFAVDLESYTAIVRSSLSFFTFAQALYTKGQ